MNGTEPLPEVEPLSEPPPTTRCQWCEATTWLWEIEIEPPIWTHQNGIKKMKRHAITAKACGPCKRRLKEHYG